MHVRNVSYRPNILYFKWTCKVLSHVYSFFFFRYFIATDFFRAIKNWRSQSLTVFIPVCGWETGPRSCCYCCLPTWYMLVSEHRTRQRANTGIKKSNRTKRDTYACLLLFLLWNQLENQEKMKMSGFAGFQLKVMKTILKIDEIHHRKTNVKTVRA